MLKWVIDKNLFQNKTFKILNPGKKLEYVPVSGMDILTENLFYFSVWECMCIIS